VPFVVSDPSLVRQLGNYRAYDGSNAALRLTVVPGPVAGEPPLPETSSGRLIASFDGFTSAQREELERLRDELRTGIERAGGLQVDPDPPLREGIEDEIDTTIAAVAALGDDADELLDSDELVSLVRILDWGDVPIGDVIEPGVVSTDDLVRYARLQSWRALGTIAVYLDELP
jgi:hypothetical protein